MAEVEASVTSASGADGSVCSSIVACDKPSLRSSKALWAWCSRDVVDIVVAYLVLHSDGTSEVREIGEQTVDS
jgi:hypothetical protein